MWNTWSIFLIVIFFLVLGHALSIHQTNKRDIVVFKRYVPFTLFQEVRQRESQINPLFWGIAIFQRLTHEKRSAKSFISKSDQKFQGKMWLETFFVCLQTILLVEILSYAGFFWNLVDGCNQGPWGECKSASSRIVPQNFGGLSFVVTDRANFGTYPL